MSRMNEHLHLHQPFVCFTNTSQQIFYWRLGLSGCSAPRGSLSLNWHAQEAEGGKWGAEITGY